MRYWLPTLLSLLLAFVAARATIAAEGEEITNDDCLGCHGTEGFTGSDDRPLYLDGEAFGHSAHALFSCTDCHSDATEIPHAELKAVSLETCETCHADEVDAYKKGVHGSNRLKGVTEAPTCQDCHGNIHALLPHTEPASAAHWSHLAKTCARCHANLQMAEKFQIPVVRPVQAYLLSVHARAVEGGVRAAVCSDCHGTHLILPSSDPQSPISRSNVPETCGKCHTEVLKEYRGSVHGKALIRGIREAPVCTDCHGEHRILSHEQPASPVFATNIPGQTCGRCHSNTRLSEKYGLAGGKVAAFEDSFHGLALRSGQLTVANCASCHGIHDILPASDPRSMINPSNLPKTCGKCHPGAGERFALGPIHVVATEFSSPGVYWIRLIYLSLIVVVIGFMVAHNAIDLGLKARSPLRLVPSIPPEESQRMPRSLRWQHGLVMLSFPVLVYSGFALTYPDSWWAAPLLHWRNGGDVRGLIHRSAAVVLLTALVWHGVELVVSRRSRKRLSGIWWSWRDLRHFLAMMGYYTGWRSSRPHGQKFTYIEKAEYWAFVWGMLIMSATGFLLWFTNAALRYLPKWTTDVATAIHFYEAVLATLAILVWHLYWVIFDPDVYPMDWSWWDGHAPATRVLERRAAEAEEPAAGSPPQTPPGAAATAEKKGEPT